MRRYTSTKTSPFLLSAIAVSGFLFGGISTHTFHKADDEENAVQHVSLTSEELEALGNFRTETEKTKQAQLLALEAEDNWYKEISKTQEARENTREAKKKLLKHIDDLELEKSELVRLQNLAKLEKQAAADAVVSSIQAKSHAEDHALYAYETTQEAKVKLKQAEKDQEQADAVLKQFADLESEIKSIKLKYAGLETKYQLVLNENQRLANKPPQVQREVVVVNTNSNHSSDYHRQNIHLHPAPYCPPAPARRPRPVCKPALASTPQQSDWRLPSAPCPAPRKQKRFK